MSISSGAYTVVSTAASGVKTGASYAAKGATYAVDKVEDGYEAVGEKWNPTVYKPAPLRDTFRSDMDRAKKDIQKIHDLYRQRNDAARVGRSTGRFDYQLQAGQTDLELAISSLEKYEGIY